MTAEKVVKSGLKSPVRLIPAQFVPLLDVNHAT